MIYIYISLFMHVIKSYIDVSIWINIDRVHGHPIDPSKQTQRNATGPGVTFSLPEFLGNAVVSAAIHGERGYRYTQGM